MWGVLSRKRFEKEKVRTRISFRTHRKDIKALQQEMISKKEIEIMIRESMLKVREQTQTTPRTFTRTPFRKKADKILNKAEIMREIGSQLQKGLSTSEIQHNVVNIKGMCKKTCFFKYLKEVRELKHELRELKPRTKL